MSWLEIALIGCALVGIAAGAFLVAQRPTFWAGLGLVVFKAAWPYIFRFVSKRMTPEEERAMQACIRSGGEWDWTRKRCKNR